METDWELNYGMGMGMDQTPAGFGVAAPAYMYSGGMPSAAETLRVDDLLDFTNHELFPSSSSSSSSAAVDTHLLAAKEFSSAVAAGGSAFTFDGVNSSYSNYPGRHSSFTDDIYIPSEEVAELEWLSQFVEESFSDVPYPNYLAEKSTMWQDGNNVHQARSQRSRDVGASSSSSSSVYEFPTTKGKANTSSRNKLQGPAEAEGTVDYGGARRCTHCASEKTPQWRTGPLGPKTLCNACGVRYKSGRLVPEYRPAASPTFVLTQHSNSHRKVVELRRQKELLILHRNENDDSAAALPELRYLDYEVC